MTLASTARAGRSLDRPVPGQADAVEVTARPLSGRAGAVALAAAVLVGAQICIAAGFYLPFLSPLVGFAACFAVPLFLVYQALGRWNWFLGAERMAVSVAGTILILMVTALVINTVLPHVGVGRPLDTVPVLISADLVDLGLLAVAFRSMPLRWRLGALAPAGWRGRLCTGVAVLTVPLAAMGAVRINNGAGSGLTLFDLALVVVAMALLLRWRDLVDSSVAPLTIYSVALALLFMTSLRGWYTTGHDVQHEMMSFLATSHRGLWTTGVHDGYNSCLSITMLPTVIQHWTGVADPYVFKVFFQPLYAFCPVAVYYLSRRITSDAMSIVATFFFVGFVGYMQDMPMLNRQEIAFVFFASALLVAFMRERSARWRGVAFCLLGAGTILSHYSTAYFGIAALAGALILRLALADLLPRVAPWWRRVMDARPAPDLLSWRVLAFLVVLVGMWEGPVNHSGGALFSQVGHAVQGAVSGSSTRSGDVSYSVAGPGRGSTEAQAFTDLLKAEKAIVDRHPAYFVPAPGPSARLTPLVPAQAQVMPVTALGRELTGSAHSALTLNRFWRDVSAYGLQVLLAIGVVLVLFLRRYAATFSTDAIFLAVTMAALLVVQVVLPSVSLDYGVGRSFMQALMVLGPFLAIGAAALAGLVASRWRTGLAFGFAGAIFVSTSGLVPQLTGSYGAQLHLDNSGDYYNRYYLHPQEVSALTWVKGSVIPSLPRYPDIQMDADLFNEARSMGGIRAYDDIYPSDIRRDAFVMLDQTNVISGLDIETFGGYELWIRYPTAPLARAKSLIYDNGGAQIYR